MSIKTMSIGIRTVPTGLVALGAALALAACGSGNSSTQGSTPAESTAASAQLPTGGEPANLDPSEFSTDITNPYWPMKPGDRWIYSETADGEQQKVVVTVTDRTKRIANGVEARVVHDVVSAPGGGPIEVTDDYYAQDADGNIWYLGEDTAEYENGKVSSREGSFEAGVDGAEAGVAMPADPQPGLVYRQEYKAGEAEDYAKVLATNAKVAVPFGSHEGALKTEDVNPLAKPRQVENKFYAKGVGPVLTLDVGGSGREELVSYRPGG